MKDNSKRLQQTSMKFDVGVPARERQGDSRVDEQFQYKIL